MIDKTLIDAEIGEESPMWNSHKGFTKRELVGLIERDSIVSLAKQIEIYEFLEKHNMVDTWDKEHSDSLWGGLKESVEHNIFFMKEHNPLLWNFVAKRDFKLYHYGKKKETK
jgi:hypothetical protein